MLSGESNQNGERTTIGLISNSCYEKIDTSGKYTYKKTILGILVAR